MIQHPGSQIYTIPPDVVRYFGPRAGGITYLWQDEFTGDEASPLATPKAVEVGTRTVVQPQGSLSIVSGELVGAVPAVIGQDYIHYGPQAFSAGLCAMWSVAEAGGRSDMGLYTTPGGALAVNMPTFERVAVDDLRRVYCAEALFNLSSMYSSYSGSFYMIRREGYGIFFVVGSELVYAGTKQFSGNMYPKIFNYTKYARPYRYAYCRGAIAGAPWLTKFGVADAYSASASAGATLSGSANGHVYCLWTPGAGETLNLMVRWTDDNNAWYVRCNQAGSTIKLIQVQAGVETERSSAAQTWTPGTAYNINATLWGNIIYTMVNDAYKASYTSATFNNTATTAKTSLAVADFAYFPRTLTGAALAALQAVG